MRWQIYFLILLFCPLSLNAQDTLKTRKIKVLPVPAFGYAPETKTYIGAVALFTMDLYSDTLTRSSNAKIEFNYTWRKQVIAETEWNYFFQEERWFTQGLVHYSRYPDFYFGIGASTPDSGKILFESDRFKFDINLQRQLRNRWFVGFGLRYIDYSRVQTESTQYSELDPASTTGFQFILNHDLRNNLLTPTSGSYFMINNKHLFAPTYYSHLTVDARKYITFGKKIKQTVSTRIYSHHILGKAPFFDLAMIGGDRFVRGYFYGRYRENNLSTLQTEYRATLFWRIGLAVFGGVTLIYPDLQTVNHTNVKPNTGVGLRFLVDKKEGTNLRFDYAVGANGQNGFYVSFGESF